MQNILETVKRLHDSHSTIHVPTSVELNKVKWVFLRVTFLAWVALATLTVVSAYLTAPISSYYFFGSWKFWKYWSPGWRLSYHVYRILYMMLRGRFILSVPLTSPPSSVPDRSIVRISEQWEHGESCGSCGVCCELLSCPLMEKEQRICLGYNSFFWRYFNCGRFPSSQREIDHYNCRKWEMRKP